MGGNRQRREQPQDGQQNENPLNLMFWLITTMYVFPFSILFFRRARCIGRKEIRRTTPVCPTLYDEEQLEVPA